MKRYELTIDANNLPNWCFAEGTREILQNAVDGEVEHNARMSVEFLYRQRKGRPVGTLVVCNEGATIPREAFLTGFSTKRNRSDLIGKFGNGFKDGILALLRLGYDIKIRNGSESWNPAIVQSKDYNAQVLAFDVNPNNKFENRVQIEILGIKEEDWNEIRGNFLFIEQPNDDHVISVPEGRILLEPKYAGKLYVKGIFVCHNHRFNFGYDFRDADLDHDRRMINDPGNYSSRLLSSAAKKGKLVDKLYRMLHEGNHEAENVSRYDLNDEAIDEIVERFQFQYGKETIPTLTEEQVSQLSHLGVRGVQMPRALYYILSDRLGHVDDNLKKLRRGTKHIYCSEELSDEENKNFEQAKNILNSCLPKINFDANILNCTSVVEFADEKILGIFDYEQKSIRISKRCLASVSKCLRVMIHEISHVCGGDGTKQHEATIGTITEAVMEYFLNPQNS